MFQIRLFFFPLLLCLLACASTQPAPLQPPPPSETCDTLTQAVQAAALTEAVCETDADCGIRPVAACNIKGIGCFTHITNPANPAQPLDDAIQALRDHPCILSKCDCGPAPTQFSCEESRCVEKVCWEDVKVKCDPDSTCPDTRRERFPCPPTP